MKSKRLCFSKVWLSMAFCVETIGKDLLDITTTLILQILCFMNMLHLTVVICGKCSLQRSRPRNITHPSVFPLLSPVFGFLIVHFSQHYCFLNFVTLFVFCICVGISKVLQVYTLANFVIVALLLVVGGAYLADDKSFITSVPHAGILILSREPSVFKIALYLLTSDLFLGLVNLVVIKALISLQALLRNFLVSDSLFSLLLITNLLEPNSSIFGRKLVTASSFAITFLLNIEFGLLCNILSPIVFKGCVTAVRVYCWLSNASGMKFEWIL